MRIKNIFNSSHTICLLMVSSFFYSSCETKKIDTSASDGYYRPLVDTILHHSNNKFDSIEKDDVTFYYKPDAFFNSSMGALIDDAIDSRDQCIRLLGNVQTSYSIKVIYFNDREKLRPYLNMAPKGLALPDAYTLLIATNDTIRAYHKHEMMHIISINQFGGYAAHPSDWIQEGIAVYADNPCMSYPVHAISAYLFFENQLPSLDSLFYQFRSLPDMPAYMAAGSISQFIVEKYGLKKFEQLWKQGADKLYDVIGMSREELEREYHQFLKQQYPQRPELDWELLNATGCG